MTGTGADATALVAKRCVVSGKVQGVYFRASTQHQARHLNVEGYAKNLADGRVEVLAVGTPSQVDALVHWLRRGPPTSKVTGVEVFEVPASEFVAAQGFATL